MAYLEQSADFSKAVGQSYETSEIKRGEIYSVDLEDIDYTSTPVIGKTSPGLIIQNDDGNMHGDTTIIAPITSQYKRYNPFQYKFMLGGKTSVIMFEQIMTVEQFRLKDKIGELTPAQMKEAEKALRFSLHLNKLSLKDIVNFDIISMIMRKN